MTPARRTELRRIAGVWATHDYPTTGGILSECLDYIDELERRLTPSAETPSTARDRLGRWLAESPHRVWELETESSNAVCELREYVSVGMTALRGAGSGATENEAIAAAVDDLAADSSGEQKP